MVGRSGTHVGDVAKDEAGDKEIDQVATVVVLFRH